MGQKRLNGLENVVVHFGTAFSQIDFHILADGTPLADLTQVYSMKNIALTWDALPGAALYGLSANGSYDWGFGSDSNELSDICFLPYVEETHLRLTAYDENGALIAASGVFDLSVIKPETDQFTIRADKSLVKVGSTLPVYSDRDGLLRDAPAYSGSICGGGYHASLENGVYVWNVNIYEGMLNYICWAEDENGNISNIISYSVVPDYGGPSIVLPADLTSIEAEAFADTYFTTVIVPPSCRYIGSRAFAGNVDYYEVHIMGSQITIADDAFEGANVIICCRADNSALIEWCDNHGIAVQPE